MDFMCVHYSVLAAPETLVDIILSFQYLIIALNV